MTENLMKLERFLVKEDFYLELMDQVYLQEDKLKF